MILKKENFKILKLPSSAYDYVVNNDSWFLILKMNGYLAAWFYKFHELQKQKSTTTKQRDRPSHVSSWSKVLWKATTEKRKYYILRKVLHFKVKAVY